MSHLLRGIATTVALSTSLVVALPALAAPLRDAPGPDSSAPSLETEPVTIDLHAGLGGGSAGIAGTVGMQGHYFIEPTLGVGLTLTGVGVANADILGPGRSLTMFYAGPTGALRGGEPGEELLLSVGGGIGPYQETQHAGFCMDLDDSGDCPRGSTRSALGLAAEGTVAWYGHIAGPVDMGPVGRFIAFGPTSGGPVDVAFTVNLGLRIAPR